MRRRLRIASSSSPQTIELGARLAIMTAIRASIGQPADGAFRRRPPRASTQTGRPNYAAAGSDAGLLRHAGYRGDGPAARRAGKRGALLRHGIPAARGPLSRVEATGSDRSSGVRLQGRPAIRAFTGAGGDAVNL